MECPVCGGANVAASHRRGAERLVRYIVPRAPYRCKDCWSRFWRFESPWKTAGAKIGALAVVLALVGLIGLPFWSRNATKAPPKPETEPRGESFTLPVPTHRAPQRAYDPEMDGPRTAATDVPETNVAPAAPVAPPPVPESPSVPAVAPPEPAAPETPVASTPKDAEPPASLASADATGPKTAAEPASAPELSADKGGGQASAPSEAPKDAELPPVPEGPRTLRNIVARTASGVFEMAVDAGGPVDAPKIFSLGSPPKLVVDLAGEWRREAKAVVPASGGPVLRIRTGLHPEYLRIVLDLAETGPLGHEVISSVDGFRLRVFPEGGS